MTRRQAREQAFVLLFEKSFREEDMHVLISLANESRVLVAGGPDVPPESWEMPVDPFAEQTVLRVQEHVEEIDGRIERLSVNWKKNRISRVAFSVLRLALYEMLYEPEIPVGVAINEAVEISKKYAGEEDSAFVNGLLGSAAKELEAQGRAQIPPPDSQPRQES